MIEGVEINPGALLAVAESDFVRAEIQAVGNRIAANARSNAPRGTGKRYGHGANTIHAETSLDAGEWTARVSWDQLHAYMRFPELGTQGPHGQPAQHFLLHAADHTG